MYFKYFAIAFIIFLWLSWLWSRRYYYGFAWRFPGKFGWPIIGNLLAVDHIDHSMRLFGSFFEAGHRTTCAWLGLNPSLVTIEPTVIEKVLNSPDCIEKSMPLYEPIHYALKGGIVTASARKWRFYRKNICVIFKQKTLLSFFPIFNEAKDKLIKNFELLADEKEHFVLDTILNNIALIASETLAGIKLTDERVPEMVQKFMSVLHQVAKQSIFTSLKLQKILRQLPTFRKDLQSIYNFIENLIVEWIHGKEKALGSDIPPPEENQKPIILAEQVYKMYKAQKFNWEDVLNTTLTFIVGPLETTSNTIYSAIIFLAMHPPIQQRVFEEILNVFKDKDSDVSYEDLKQLPYLEQVILETMRLTPAFPIIGRQTSKPFELPNGEIVPGDMSIFISIYHLHRSKEIWGPNADNFDPDNFLAEKITKRRAYDFIPFSKGVRNCIGYRYAELVLKVMLVGLIRNFRFETNFKYEDLEVKFNISSAFIRNPALRIYKRL